MIPKQKQLFRLLFKIWVLVLFVVILVGCGNPEDFIATHEPTSTSITPCPEYNFDEPDQVKLEPILMVVLLETSPQYEPYTQIAQQLIEKLYSERFMPNDRLVLINMQNFNLDEGVIRLQVDEFLPPEVSESPTPLPTITPSLVPSATPASFAWSLTRQALPKVQTEIAAEETDIAFKDNCAMDLWGAQNAIQETEWAGTVNQAVEGFNQEFEKKFAEFESGEGRLQVYEVLEHASIQFENECELFDACVLVVFSFMNEFRHETPDDVQISFVNTQVRIVYLDCEVSFETKCENREDDWRPEFNKYGVDDEDLEFIGSEDAEEKLLEVMRR